MLEKVKKFYFSSGFRSLASVLVIVLMVLNLTERLIAFVEINVRLEKFQLSRLMLNSRAKIQIILCNAALEGRRLSASEIDTIKVLWKDAEYDRAFEATGSDAK